MTLRFPARRATPVLVAALLIACSDVANQIAGPPPIRIAPTLVSIVSTPSVVISQVYGGGGNSGSTLKNDFIELFNPGTSPVDLTGWSVQYASSAGTSWQVTNLSGTLQPGNHYLVQEGAGGGGTVSLPTPDATGAIAMSATSGKVLVAHQTTSFTGTGCPSGGTVSDVVGFGTSADCAGTTANLSATLAALRKDAGCTYTGSTSADFEILAPNPRNTSSAPHSCSAPPPVVASVTVTPDPASVDVGSTTAFTAVARDASSNVVSTTFTWSSGSPSIATVDASGVATGVSAGGPVTITATASNGVSGSAQLTVTPGSPPPPPPDVVISQIYGGGGNSGAAYTNDYVEIFNHGDSPADVTGWKIQYTSASGNTWSSNSVTLPATTLPIGGYYLVQLASGGATGAALPTPDFNPGTINMSATSGKVILIQPSVTTTASCPTGAGIVDHVGYGTSANCNTEWGGSTANASATNAVIRKNSGCESTNNVANDFAVLPASPRNSATPVHSCVVGPLDHVVITGPSQVQLGSNIQLSATAQDAANAIISGAVITWSSSDDTKASVDATGKVSGVSFSASPITITATAVAGGITKTASVQITITDPNAINWLDISYSPSSIPPGFQAQFFLTARVASGGAVVPATFTYESLDPDIATVGRFANSNYITGVGTPGGVSVKPRIRITATPNSGGAPYVFTTGTGTSITIEPAVQLPVSAYGLNEEFGDPTGVSATNPDDFLIVRRQFTISYNQSRGTPNWVSYELDSRQFGSEDRCNCFSADPLIPADKQIFTSNYTNGGFDRGHMGPSADRKGAIVDNATTFYLSNIVPQQGDLNQGVWARFEDALRDSATAGRAVYIIVGPLYSRSHGLSFVKNEGKIAIPDSTWKVAFIGPMTGGSPFTRANLQSWDDLRGLTVLAVNMPNITGVRNIPWQTYLTTVDKIEDATGYDILSLLPVAFQGALEAGDHAPTAQFTAPASLNEGTAGAFDASASSDPDIGRTDMSQTEALTYAWHFSDGTDATGAIVNKTFATAGSFTATLTITDAFGWQHVVSHAVTVNNVAPVASLTATTPISILSGDAAGVSGGFTDPGLDSPWAYVLNFGNGTTAAGNFSTSADILNQSSTFLLAGSYTITFSVTDKFGASNTASLAVSVGRRPVAATVSPDTVSLSNNGNGNVSVTLSSGEDVNASQIDVASVRIGTVGVSQKNNGSYDATLQGGGTRLDLKFSRKSLIDAGAITADSTEIVLMANLLDGRQIVAHAAVVVR